MPLKLTSASTPFKKKWRRMQMRETAWFCHMKSYFLQASRNINGLKWTRGNSVYSIVYTYWLGMRVIALLLSPRYQLFSETTPSKIFGTEGTIKVLLPEYQVYKYFIILNNCAIQNSKFEALLKNTNKVN